MQFQVTSGEHGQRNHNTALAWWFAGGTLAVIVLSGLWGLVVGTASPGADEKDLVQGWSGVLRNLPRPLSQGSQPILSGHRRR